MQQDAVDELVVGISGAGRATVDGLASPLGLGDLVHLPVGGALEIENVGDEPLVYLIVKADAVKHGL